MAYANSVLFYGWSGKDSEAIIEKLLDNESLELIRGLEIKKSSHADHKRYKAVIELINKKLDNSKANIKFGIFEGGLSSNEYKCYLYFGSFKTNESSNSDDISETSFTIKELKNFFNLSFKFNKDHEKEKMSRPNFIHLTVADDK